MQTLFLLLENPIIIENSKQGSTYCCVTETLLSIKQARVGINTTINDSHDWLYAELWNMNKKTVNNIKKYKFETNTNIN